MHNKEEELAVITTHFNPCGFRSPVDNYFAFRDHLESYSGIGPDQLFTVELSFHGQRWEIPHAYHLEGDSLNIMWQKEALLNVALKRLPKRFKYVAWIDADLLFLNRHWAREAVDMLSTTYEAVQLFRSWSPLDQYQRTVHTWDGLASRLTYGALYSGPAAPGGAWAARRSLLDEIGFHYENIVGGGDVLMAETLLNVRNGTYAERWPQPVVEAGDNWANNAKLCLNGRVGSVLGHVNHLWHGDRRDRQWEQRVQILRQWNYNPQTDIKVRPDGVLEWASEKVGFQEAIAQYFVNRKEDTCPST